MVSPPFTRERGLSRLVVVADPQTATRARRFSAALALLVILLGVVVTIGWAQGTPALQTLLPGHTAMKANTALCLVLLGVALLLSVAWPPARPVIVVVALVPMVIAVATIVEYAAGVNLGIDQALFRDPESATNPGRMSLATALALALAAASIMLLDSPRPRTSYVVALGTLVIAAVALIGYLYGVTELYQFGRFATVPLHTAAALALLAVGILFARPDTGIMRLALAPGPGGLLMRDMLPATTLLPVALGFVVLLGARLGYYAVEFAVALLVIVIVILLRLMVFRTATTLNATDEKRRQAVESARLADERQRLVAETVADGIVIIDGSSRIEYANPAAERIFGYPEDSLVGRELTELMPERFRDRHRAALKRYQDTGRRTIAWEGTELVGLRQTGEEFPIDVAFAEGADPDHRTFTGAIRDISSRKRLEEQLLQAQRLESIGRLAGGVAHDFNNILTAIVGFDRLLLDQLPADDPRRPEAEAIEDAAERATTLVRQLLAFSRQQVMRPEVLDLGDVVRGIAPMLERLLGEDVRLSVQPASDLWPVEADRGQLEQVIVNLAVNARDAMPSGGRLTIETANVDLDADYAHKHADVSPGPHVMLGVSDTGMGMDEVTQARIFEPFFTTKDTGRGTGLGLATVYGVVRQSGGHIWVYSEPDRGTTFRVYMPRTSLPTDLPPPDTAPGAPVTGHETILVTEDEESIRALIDLVLTRLGYTVLLAKDADEALEVARHQSIDLLVSDVVLPGRSGLELAQEFASVAPDARILLMSGYTAAALEPHGPLAAGYDLLEKPFTPDSLGQAVRRALASEEPQPAPAIAGETETAG